MKKIFTLLFALAASLCMLHAAVVEGICGDNLTWSLNTQDSTLTIEGSGNMYNWGTDNIPWKEYNTYIKIVSLPEGLTSIGNCAFWFHSKLLSVNAPNSLVSIGEFSFCSCERLSDFSIPSNVKIIGQYAFSGTGLTSISIPDGVKRIEQETFHWCENLTSVSFGNGVTFIGQSAFERCGLTSITFPNSVIEIGPMAFWECNNLTSVIFGNKVEYIRTSAFGNCSNLSSSLTLPNSLKELEAGAFANCGLTIVVLGNNIQNLGQGSLGGLNNITNLTVFAATPPTGGVNCGVNPAECNLFVRSGSVETYRNAVWWEEFLSINVAATQSYHVTFRDVDGTILSEQYIDEGGTAIAPSNPTREGYSFIGWDKDFSNVTEDLIVTALYKINRYKVDFVDWDNTLLKSDSVDWNTAAIAPANPYRKGYTFTGWNKNFEHITSDETIMAQYEMGEEKDVTVLYTNGNDGGTILSHSVVLKMPEAPEIEGFTFLGWQPKAEFIDEIIEIQAIYKSDSEAAPQVVANPSNPSQKLIRNGNVYILTGGKTYSITGAEVK